MDIYDILIVERKVRLYIVVVLFFFGQIPALLVIGEKVDPAN